MPLFPPVRLPESSPLQRQMIQQAFIVGGVSAIGLIGVFTSEPQLWAPWPLMQFAPATAGAPVGPFLAIVFFSIAAFVVSRGEWGRRLLGGAIALLLAMSLAYAVLRFEPGRLHQGLWYTLAADALSLGSLVYLGWRCRRRVVTMDRGAAVTHTMLLSIWLFWFAFPYLGEGL